MHSEYNTLWAKPTRNRVWRWFNMSANVRGHSVRRRTHNHFESVTSDKDDDTHDTKTNASLHTTTAASYE